MPVVYALQWEADFVYEVLGGFYLFVSDRWLLPCTVAGNGTHYAVAQKLVVARRVRKWQFTVTVGLILLVVSMPVHAVSFVCLYLM